MVPLCTGSGCERQARLLGARIALFPGFRKAYRGNGPVKSGPIAPVPVATALRLRQDVAEHIDLYCYIYKVVARVLGLDYALASSSGFPLHVLNCCSGSFHGGASPRRPRGSYATGAESQTPEP